MKYLFASLLICLSVSVHAQQNHFIYIQADNRQPFYVKLDKKILSSSTSGYLIIPKLQDSSYDISIGFPKNEWPEQKVTCNINRTDVGYLLKNFGEKGWGLFNFQTMDLVMAENKTKADSSKAVATNSDPFSNALANVVNDPAIKAVEETKEDSVAVTVPVKKITAKRPVKTPVKAKGKDVTVIKTKDRISKLLSKRNADGLKMVYVDRVNGSVDTVNVVIPIEKPVVKVVVPKVDTSAAVKHIVSNKRPVKKPVVKTDLVKVDRKTTRKVKDSIAAISPDVKTIEAKTDIVVENKNPVNSIDSTNTNQPAKKLEDIIADMAKNDNKTIEPVKDSTVNTTSEVKVPEIKNDVALEHKDTVVLKDTTTAMPLVVAPVDTVSFKESITQKTATTDSTVNTTADNKTEQSKPEPAKEVVKEPVTQRADSSITTSVEKPDVKKVETIVPDKKVSEPVVVEKPKDDIAPKANAAAPVYACKYVADGDEFMSLRKKMLKGKNDDEMLSVAHQLFLKHCVTTKQVERLGVLLSNDAAKYKLFEEAYHYTVDQDIFSSLQSQLTDPDYIRRFKAMLH